MTRDVVQLNALLGAMAELWAPHRVATVNDYDVKVAKIQGEFVEHAHDETDEFFLVLDGELHIALRDRTVVLPRGSVFVVPRGVEHKPISSEGASILMFEPTGTSSVGDRHDPVPSHVDATTGYALG